MKFQGTLRHDFCHSRDEDCNCFKFLDDCDINRIVGLTLFGKKLYNDSSMAYYPFWGAISNNKKIIPFGSDPVLSVIDPRGIYRLVSSRTYGNDSTIYFDSQLRPLHHIYSHKIPFKHDLKTYSLEEKILKSYPNKPEHVPQSEYMNWTWN